MKWNIAVLAPKHFCEHLKLNLQFYHLDFSQKCNLRFCEYERLSELPKLHDALWSEVDGFCVAGSFTKKLLFELAEKPLKPIQSISARSTEYFKEFFHLVNRDRSIDFGRVVIDSFLWGGGTVPKTVNEFIGVDRRLVDIRKALLDSMSTEDILNTEQLVLENAKALWEQGAIDRVVCRLATAYPLLCKAGIPCSFVYPTSDTVVDSIEMLTGRISLEQIEEEQPAVIYITSEELQKDIAGGLGTNALNLQKAIHAFDHENTTGFVLKQSMNGCEAYTTRQVVKRITDGFTGCRLKKYILSQFNMQTQIGYGVGQTVMQARCNAIEACAVAKQHAESYLMHADGSLVGPLDSENVLKVAGEISASVFEAAKRCGLSVSTIQRILSVMELLHTDKMTAQELASALQVTVANANRFMNALVKGGAAEVISEKKSLSKGRPSRVYRISLNQ